MVERMSSYRIGDNVWDGRITRRRFLQGLGIVGLTLGIGAINGRAGSATEKPCVAPGSSFPGEIIAEGWERSYRAGCPDDSGKVAGGSQLQHLVGHQGKLYAAVGYWNDSRNIWYGGNSADTGWAQILRLDGPTARWQVDLEMTMHLRPEILYSATFNTNGKGDSLSPPVNLLLASSYEGGGERGISLYTRNDATGKWEKSKIISGDTGKRGESNSVRAMCVHRDRVTGVDRLFVSIGVLGIFSGIYDPTAPGRFRWEGKSESGPLATRPLAIIEANGSLHFSSDKFIYRRKDGPSPSYEKVHDLSDLLPGKVNSPIGGIRGLTAIPNPSGSGQSLIFLWTPDQRSRGSVIRLDPDGKGGYTRVREVYLDTLVSQYLGSPVYFVLGAYNNFLAVTDPTTRESKYLVGMEVVVPSQALPVRPIPGTPSGFYEGALYAIRNPKGEYRLNEVNGRFPPKNPGLQATYCYAVSPFPADRGEVIYFGGYDGNNMPSTNMAWIFRTSLANALRVRS
jgi:hypothetical protein